MSEYFACRDNHILQCLLLFKIQQFLIPTFAAEKKKPLFKIWPLRYMSSIEDNICSLHMPLSDKHAGYSQICTHFCRLRQNMNLWNTDLLPQFFFLSLNVKNSFNYKLSTYERIWHSILRGSEAGKYRVLLLRFAQDLLKLWNHSLSISFFSF